MKRGFGVLVCLLLGGCLGFRFGPGYSCDDENYFSARPVVVEKGDQFFLRWRFGEMGFSFEPGYAVREGALWFSLQGTSSSGALKSRERDMEIKGKDAFVALRSGGAYWWSSDGTLTELEIISEPVEWPLPVDPETNP